MTMPQNQTGIEFSASKFYMWRCVVTMAHADGLVQQEEKSYLTTLFSNMKQRAGLPDDYYQQLLADIDEPQDTAAMLSHINDPAYRAQVIYFARLLAYKDGELHPSEQQLLDKMHLSVAGNLDMESIRKQVRENVQQDLVLHEIAKDSQRPDKGLSGLLDRFCLAFGIDLMDE